MKQIKRELYLNQIRKYYELDLIKVLTGVRRSGKSIILKQIIEELKLKTDDKHIIYVNFEDDRLLGFVAKDFNDIVETAHELTDNKTVYYFFDEI